MLIRACPIGLPGLPETFVGQARDVCRAGPIALSGRPVWPFGPARLLERQAGSRLGDSEGRDTGSRMPAEPAFFGPEDFLKAPIDAAMKYIDTGRVGRDRAPRGPQSKHGENTLTTIAGRSGIAPYQ